MEGREVGDVELIARLLHGGNADPEQRRFPRDELFPRRGQLPSNECGRSNGVSVVRRDTLSDDDLRARSVKQASKVPGRLPLGAIVAPVAGLRAIRMQGNDKEQVVFVYDDPGQADPLHAVVRGKETLNRAEQSELRNEVVKVFATCVPQAADFQAMSEVAGTARETSDAL